MTPRRIAAIATAIGLAAGGAVALIYDPPGKGNCKRCEVVQLQDLSTTTPASTGTTPKSVATKVPVHTAIEICGGDKPKLDPSIIRIVECGHPYSDKDKPETPSASSSIKAKPSAEQSPADLGCACAASADCLAKGRKGKLEPAPRGVTLAAGSWSGPCVPKSCYEIGDVLAGGRARLGYSWPSECPLK